MSAPLQVGTSKFEQTYTYSPDSGTLKHRSYSYWLGTGARYLTIPDGCTMLIITPGADPLAVLAPVYNSGDRVKGVA